MIRYGFELEGYWKTGNSTGLPPKTYPTDGFPGLIEFRTVNHHTLIGAWIYLLKDMFQFDLSGFDSSINEHTFTAEEKRILRKRNWGKTPVDVQNLYDKKPRPLGNKSIASFQINLSNCTRLAYTDDKGVKHPDLFTALDVGKIVKSLDNEFKSEIKSSGRQVGEYAIKGNRLEYRSLPNFVAPWNEPMKVKNFLERIRKCCED